MDLRRLCDIILTEKDLGGDGDSCLSCINFDFVPTRAGHIKCQCSAQWLYPSYPEGTPPYLLSDRAGTLNQLPLGVAVCGAHLEGPRLLHQEDTAMAKVLHTCANLESNLQRRESQEREGL